MPRSPQAAVSINNALFLMFLLTLCRPVAVQVVLETKPARRWLAMTKLIPAPPAAMQF